MAILSFSILGLSGCALNMKATEDQANHNIKATDHLVNQAQMKPSSALIQFDKGIFVADKAFKVKEKPQPLPQVFDEGFYFNSNQKLTLTQVSNTISEETGVMIRVSNDAKAYIENTDKSTGKNGSNQSNVVNNQPPLTGHQDGKEDNKEPTMQLHFTGTLKGLLNQITSNNGLYWQYDHTTGIVQIFHYETKTFEIDLLQGKTQVKDTIKNSSSNDTLTPQLSSVDYDSGQTNQWQAAVDVLNNIIGGSGSIGASPESGYITVTTTPDLMAQAASYIDRLNKAARKRIAIKVDIYDVEATNGSNYGLNWNAIYKTTSAALNWDTTGMPNALPNPFSSTIQTAIAKAAINSGILSGSQFIFSALQSVGKTTYVKGDTAYTVNGHPTALNISTSIAYVKERDVTVTGGDTGSVQASTTPGTINTGFLLKFMPRIIKGNEVLLNLSVGMSSLKSMRESKTGSGDNESYVELPTTESKNFMQALPLESGQSFILAAFHDDGASVGENSIDGKHWALGGNKATSKVHDMTVVVVTPYIISNN
ncbi:hypothetical protein [Cysteiniphilum halobium]|uniref:hypothetical protein n=1 Tax=Cysteiniphilum halobium TaxID=2219059 RepID=UPI0013C3046E|nr:hypothetical protein [Cysteiniphilum halobium]